MAQNSEYIPATATHAPEISPRQQEGVSPRQQEGVSPSQQGGGSAMLPEADSSRATTAAVWTVPTLTHWSPTNGTSLRTSTATPPQVQVFHVASEEAQCQEIDDHGKIINKQNTGLSIHVGLAEDHSLRVVITGEIDNVMKVKCKVVDQSQTKTQKVGQSQKNDVNLNTHKRLRGNDALLCAVCGKQLSSTSTLRNHMMIHTGEKPYKCEHCDKRFTQTGDLKNHMMIHTGERPYKCEHCDKKFNRSGHLKTHTRIHTGEKPYKCEHCDAKFRQSCFLIRHMKIHTGEKPHTCEYCGRRFREIQSMKTHVRIHTGEKPYKCEHCDKRFTQSGTRKIHMRTHTGERHRGSVIKTRVTRR